MKSIILIILLCPLLTMCQSITINGKIINEEGDPIPSATITLKRTNQSTVSDVNGRFTVHDSRLTDTIIVTASGYEPYQEPNNIRGEILVILKRSVKSLGEVIVNTGYVSMPVERMTGAFEKIDTRLLSRKVGNDWLSRLEGQSGVYFDRRGLTGGAFTIRGRSTLFANAVPLVILDNFPYDGDLNNINPNDIENITILKDAAAASVWGVRAANGVIVITSKKGKPSKSPSLELNANVTVAGKPDLFYSHEFMNASDFIDVELLLFGKGFYNSVINNTTSRPPLSPVEEILARRRAGSISAADSAAQIDVLRKADVRNDLDRYFYRASLSQQYALNYSGASQHIAYFFSGGFDKINSGLVGNNNNRLTFLSRTAYKPLNRLEITLDLAVTRSMVQVNNAASISIGSGKNLYPYAVLADETGLPLPVVKDYRFAYIDTVGSGRLLDWKYRPLDELHLSDNTSQQSDFRSSVSVSYKINSHVTALLLYQLEKQIIEGQNLYGTSVYFTRNLINRYYNPSTGKYAIPVGAVLDLSHSSLLSQQGRGQLNFHQAWSALHEVSAVAGFELKQSVSSLNSYRTYGFNDEVLTYTNVNLSDNLPVYNNLSSAQPIPNPAQFTEGTLRYVSFYATAAYTYRKKYTLTGSARKDASNIFGVNANQKWVPLWSSGFSWQINNEKFYKSRTLPYLRLRLTYGYNGNVDNTLSAFTTIRYSNSSMFINQPYAVTQTPPNPELRWEKTSVLNWGIDFSFKNDRISGSMDIYNKKGKDIIGQSPLDPTTGVRNNLLQFTFKGNVAAMKGNGIELALNSQNLVGAFKWNTSLLFNHVISKVTSYYLTSLNASSFLNLGTAVNPVPGKPLYSIYSFAWAGLDPATGDPQGYLNGTVSKDYSALTAVTVDKLNYNGSAVPVNFGSLLNTFEWKHFSLSVNLIYKLGYYFRRSSVNYNSLFNNWFMHSDYADRWQKPGDELFTNVPSLIYPNPNSNRDNFYSLAAPLVEKGDHIRLQDISLAYNITGDNKSTFKNLKLYAYINNIGILWKANKAGLDPDYFSGGYPLPVTFSFGIKTNL